MLMSMDTESIVAKELAENRSFEPLQALSLKPNPEP